jgi:hypothetical protein
LYWTPWNPPHRWAIESPRMTLLPIFWKKEEDALLWRRFYSNYGKTDGGTYEGAVPQEQLAQWILIRKFFALLRVQCENLEETTSTSGNLVATLTSSSIYERPPPLSSPLPLRSFFSKGRNLF